MKIVIIDYGAGNVQSVKFAVKRLGFEAVVSHNAGEIQAADKVIFPGVGEAGSAMKRLRERQLDTVIPKLQQPVLGICLGMQLLCAHSEEGNTKALGVFDPEVVQFPKTVKVPQIGWNQISGLQSDLFQGIEENAYVYLVHSYYAPLGKASIATATYAFPYSAALHKENFYGVQFHPEKSSEVGAQILQNFLTLL